MVAVPHAGAHVLDDMSIAFTRIDTTFHAESYPIASPLKGGPLRLLYIGRAYPLGRFSMEIAARLECQYETLLTSSRTSFGTKSPWKEYQSDVLTDEALINRCADLLKEKWDVVWLDYELSMLPFEVLASLMKNVEDGTGLVYVGDSTELEVLVTKDKIDTTGLDTVFGARIHVQAVGMKGKGFLISVPSINDLDDYSFVGDYMSAMVNTTLFASQRKTGITIEKVASSRKTIEQEAIEIMKYRLDIRNTESTTQMTVVQVYRDKNDNVVYKSTDDYKVNKGNSFLILSYPLLNIGKYSIDISIVDPDGVVAIAGKSIEVSTIQYISNVNFWEITTAEGEFATGTVYMTSEFKDGMSLEIDFFDNWGRLLDTSVLETLPSRMSADFTFRVRKTLGRSFSAKVRFYKNNILVQVYELSAFINRPYNRNKFAFCVSDDGFSHFMRKSLYEFLNDNGVTTFILNFKNNLDRMSVHKRISEAYSAGTTVIPEYSFVRTVTDDKKKKTDINSYVKAVTDTIRHFNPPAYLLNKSILYSEGLTYGPFSDDFTHILGQLRNTIKASDQDAFVGIADMPFNGNDINDLNRETLFDLTDILFSEFDAGSGLMGDDLIMKTTRPRYGNDVFSCILTGGESFRRANEPLLRVVPWQSLFYGMDGIVWKKGCGDAEAALTPAFSLSPAFATVADEVAEITKGIDLLINHATPVDGLSDITLLDENGNKPEDISIVTFMDGETEYIGIISYPTLIDSEQTSEKTYTLSIDRPENIPVVYDVRNELYLGSTATIQVKLIPGQTLLFALIPYKVRSVSVSLKKPLVKLGDTVEYSIKVNPQVRTDKCGHHVFKIEVINPDGVECPFFAESLSADNGNLEGSFPLAFNDIRGRYTIRVKDITTGKTDERSFMVMVSASDGVR